MHWGSLGGKRPARTSTCADPERRQNTACAFASYSSINRNVQANPDNTQEPKRTNRWPPLSEKSETASWNACQCSTKSRHTDTLGNPLAKRTGVPTHDRALVNQMSLSTDAGLLATGDVGAVTEPLVVGLDPPQYQVSSVWRLSGRLKRNVNPNEFQVIMADSAGFLAAEFLPRRSSTCNNRFGLLVLKGMSTSACFPDACTCFCFEQKQNRGTLKRSHLSIGVFCYEPLPSLAADGPHHGVALHVQIGKTFVCASSAASALCLTAGKDG